MTKPRMIRPLVVYVAGPYSSDPEFNTQVAMDFGSALIAEGVAPIVPHLNHFMHLRVPQAYETWMSVDFTLIRRCNLVVRLPGLSPGADREVAFALGARIPVVEVKEFEFPAFPQDFRVPQNVKDEIARLTNVIDSRTLKKNPAVDVGLLETLRRQDAELTRLCRTERTRSYDLLPPFENPLEQRVQRTLHGVRNVTDRQ